MKPYSPRVLAQWEFKKAHYRIVVRYFRAKEPSFVVEKCFLDALESPSWHLYADHREISEPLLALAQALEAETHTLEKNE